MDKAAKSELCNIIAQRLLYGLGCADDILGLGTKNGDNAVAVAFISHVDSMGQLLQDYNDHETLAECFAHNIGHSMNEEHIAPFVSADVLEKVTHIFNEIADSAQTPRLESLPPQSLDEYVEELLLIPDESDLPDAVIIPAWIAQEQKHGFINDMKTIAQANYSSWAGSDEPDDENFAYYERGNREAYLWINEALDELAATKAGMLFVIRKNASFVKTSFDTGVPPMLN